MKWYLIKTWLGKEEELAEEIRRAVPSHMYQECFVIYQERIWRRQQRSIVHVEPLLPGCVFLTCDEIRKQEKTDSLFRCLEGIPSTGRLAAGSTSRLLPMREEDVEFLRKLADKNHLVRLSYVGKDGQGRIREVTGPLGFCAGQVERYQFKKRYAVVRHRLWGEDQAVVLGILLEEDHLL